MGLDQVLPLQVSVDLGVMAMKGYSAFPKAPGQCNKLTWIKIKDKILMLKVKSIYLAEALSMNKKNY